MERPVAPSLPDAVKGHWAERWAPAGLKPYLRLARIERPIGWWLLLLPCWWSAALAAIAAGQSWPNPVHCLLFLIGAVAMRGAGCTYNDLADEDIAQPSKRLSLDLPAGVHTRFKTACSATGRRMVGELQDFIERRTAELEAEAGITRK